MVSLIVINLVCFGFDFDLFFFRVGISHSVHCAVRAPLGQRRQKKKQNIYDHFLLLQRIAIVICIY